MFTSFVSCLPHPSYYQITPTQTYISTSFCISELLFITSGKFKMFETREKKNTIYTIYVWTLSASSFWNDLHKWVTATSFPIPSCPLLFPTVSFPLLLQFFFLVLLRRLVTALNLVAADLTGQWGRQQRATELFCTVQHPRKEAFWEDPHNSRCQQGPCHGTARKRNSPKIKLNAGIWRGKKKRPWCHALC